MDVAIVAASKHGATWSVALRIASVLTELGHDVRCLAPADAEALKPGEAVLIGSGIYAGSWLRPAATFVDRHAADLTGREVWAFSCGPVGDPLVPAGRPTQADSVAAKAGAREHRVFPGVIDRSQLSRVERTILRVVKATDGDYRDWDEIDAWARQVSASLPGAA